MTLEPTANFRGYEHILNGMANFVHPHNGNMYAVSIEKLGGLRQDMSIYRTRPGSTNRELVRRYIGGADSMAQIAAGGCVILQDGTLEVWCSAVPPGPRVTGTGFQCVYDRIPSVDAPWSAQAGAGGVTLFPNLMTNPAWEGRTISAGEWVDVPAVFGVPSASAYLIRFVALAPAADVRVRAGTEQSPSFLTMNSQAANLQQHIQGWAPGPRMYVSVANGSAQVWLQIVGIA